MEFETLGLYLWDLFLSTLSAISVPLASISVPLASISVPLVFVRSKNLANFNFAKAGARLGPAVRSDGGGPSLGKIKI